MEEKNTQIARVDDKLSLDKNWACKMTKLLNYEVPALGFAFLCSNIVKSKRAYEHAETEEERSDFMKMMFDGIDELDLVTFNFASKHGKEREELLAKGIMQRYYYKPQPGEELEDINIGVTRDSIW